MTLERAAVGSVAVLLPTRNGASTLGEVLEALRGQACRHDIEVAAIDTDSTDGTRELLGRYGVRTKHIRRDAFGHGRTRNELAEMVPGARYLVYLSQDATPVGPWLEGLLDAVTREPDVAGAFSRQLPRPDANPLVARRMLEEWPQVGGADRIEKRLAPECGAAIDHEMAHFANTSSCVRRDVWSKIPFPDVPFAEDVAWACLVLAAGYRLVYEPRSVVLHSHGGSAWRQLRENIAHGRAIRSVFGKPGAAMRPMPARHGAFARARRDLEYIARLDRPVADRLAWLCYAPVWHLASTAGQWIGHRMPPLSPYQAAASARQAGAAGGEGIASCG